MMIAILHLLLATTVASAPIPKSHLPPTVPDTRLPGAAALEDNLRDSVLTSDLRKTMAIIDNRRKSGDLTRAEARAFKREARLIRGMRSQLGSDGLSDSELRSIELRSQALKAAVLLNANSN